MKELIPKDYYGVFADKKSVARVDSLFVAKFFEKEHKNVLADIENLDCSEEFNRLNFQPITYKDSKGRKQKAYAMTRDGFTFLAMGYRGKKAAYFKELYIKRFNEMEKFIQTLAETKEDYSILTQNIKLLHKDPKPYHYSNEIDMINKIVTGMSTKKFREAYGVPKGESIRPYLSAEELDLMEKLQKADVGLLIAFPDYVQRKECLEKYVEQIRSVKCEL